MTIVQLMEVHFKITGLWRFLLTGFGSLGYRDTYTPSNYLLNNVNATYTITDDTIQVTFHITNPEALSYLQEFKTQMLADELSK